MSSQGRRIVAIAATVLVGWVAVAEADECANLAFAFAQAAASMAAKDLAALRQCVNTQISKNEQARKQDAHDKAKKTAPIGKRKRYSLIAGSFATV